jgi:hypothetical protein
VTSGWSIGNLFVRRKEVERKERGVAVYHYTTKVAEVEDERLVVADGFSPTDCAYIREILPRGYQILFRKPKTGNSAMIIDSPEGLLIPAMSFDVIAFDEESRRFYLRPLLRHLGLRDVDDLLSNATVVDEDGNRIPAKEAVPSYLPWLREVQYDKPDATLTLYTKKGGEVRKSVVDVFGKYYFRVAVVEDRYGRREKVPLFMGYVKDILNLIPPIRVKYVPTDPWRGYTSLEDLPLGDWIRLTDGEWCGWLSESSEALGKLQDLLLELLKRDVLDSVCTAVSYTSNLFVVYVDFYARPTPRLTNGLRRELREAVEKIRVLGTEEIIKNIFHLD